MSTDSEATPPLVHGAVVGAVAWFTGYVLTFAVAGTEIRESPLNAIIELTEGEPATYELVGWVFFNAHFVDIVYTGIGRALPASYIGGDGFSNVLYLVPPALLVAGGLATARIRGIEDPTRGAAVGALIAPGYFVLCLVGVFLFRVSAVGATGEPEFLTGVILAGIIYPAVFGAIGGGIAGKTSERTVDDADTS